jgi:membrane-associated phospholipid phosphatase
MSSFQIIWIAAASIAFVGWLIVSFTAPSRNRTVVEWLSATAIYLGLSTFFVSIALEQLEKGNTLLVVALGFLCVLFGGGLLVAAWKAVVAFRGGKAGETNAIN